MRIGITLVVRASNSFTINGDYIALSCTMTVAHPSNKTRLKLLWIKHTDYSSYRIVEYRFYNHRIAVTK
jgi:hypothetical protein